jgi:hypothetical protein
VSSTQINTWSTLGIPEHLAFQIVCPKWDMKMQGAASNDGRTIDGNYPAYADGVGKFTMTKR